MIKSPAWRYSTTQGGLLKNLTLTEHEVENSKDDHVLIEVINASLNPGDLKFPDTPILRWFIKRPASPCFDFCGRIKALPRNVTSDSSNLHVGQVVFGLHWDLATLGTLKTIMWVHKDCVFPLPNSMPIEHGSALGVAALTAYQAIVPYARPGGKILVLGGSGGVGTFCIQIAKALQLYVIATCSKAGAQLCKDLGADETVDYASPTYLSDLCKTQVDLVIDNVGSDPQMHYRSQGFLKPEGRFLLIALMAESWAGIRSMLVSWLCPTWLGGPSRKWQLIFTQNTISTYQAVADLASDGKLRVVVDSIYPFEGAPKAFERLKSGRAKGKIIVDVSAHGN